MPQPYKIPDIASKYALAGRAIADTGQAVQQAVDTSNLNKRLTDAVQVTLSQSKDALGIGDKDIQRYTMQAQKMPGESTDDWRQRLATFTANLSYLKNSGANPKSIDADYFMPNKEFVDLVNQKKGQGVTQDIQKTEAGTPAVPAQTTASAPVVEKPNDQFTTQDIKETPAQPAMPGKRVTAEEAATKYASAGIPEFGKPIVEQKAKAETNMTKANVGSADSFMNQAKQFKETFANDPAFAENLKLIATNKMPLAQALQQTGYKQSGPARTGLIMAATELNPTQYDENGNISGGFNPISGSAAQVGAQSEARTAGQLSDKNIEKVAKKTKATAMAQLSPEVVSGKIDQSARMATGKQLNNQRQAAQRATETLQKAYDFSNGTYENVPAFMYRDIASDYARVLTVGGAVGEGDKDKVQQMSLAGDVVGICNYVFGKTMTTAPQEALKLLDTRIKDLSGVLDTQYENQVKGTKTSPVGVPATPTLKPNTPTAAVGKPKTDPLHLFD